ncbi:MAG: hypothetical protein ACD_5C00277G0002 [uncultured bacterium]|nr:MAG: hypothetical protein ACD_5C00277G0002 [uncultured bacterium]
MEQEKSISKTLQKGPFYNLLKKPDEAEILRRKLLLGALEKVSTQIKGILR